MKQIRKNCLFSKNGYTFHKKLLRICTAILFILTIINICGCNKKFHESRFLFGTVVDVTIMSDKKNANRLFDIAFNEMKNIEDRMNLYNIKSDVSQVNKNAGNSFVKVNADTYNVISKSIEFSKLTDGAFDITIAPLIDLWGFGTEENHIPIEKELKEKIELVDYRKISFDRNRHLVKLDKRGMKIDLGAMAVGYAVDKSIEALRENGVKSALINAGGEIYALGLSPNKKAWKIGIQHPRRKNELLGTMELTNRAVSTSGDYENYFEADNNRYCHVIDARTGKPTKGIMSVTVIADNTTDADALSTSLMLMKADKALALSEKLINIDCLIVAGTDENNMKILMTKGLKEKTKLVIFR